MLNLYLVFFLLLKVPVVYVSSMTHSIVKLNCLLMNTLKSDWKLDSFGGCFTGTGPG